MLPVGSVLRSYSRDEVSGARGFPIDVVGKGMANRRFEKDLFATRELLGMRVIEMGKATKGVLRSLGRGRVAALLGDQRRDRSDPELHE